MTIFRRYLVLRTLVTRIRTSHRYFPPPPQLLQPPAHSTTAVILAISGLTFSSTTSRLEQKVYGSESDDALQAQEMFDGSVDRRQIFDFLQQRYSKETKDLGVLWRLARAAYDVANLKSTSAVEKKELMYYAFEVIQQGLSLCDENFAIHKWYGIILSEIGDFEGTKASIANSYIIRDHWSRAIELNPNDATSHHLLGRWCASVCGISWIQRKIASALFGSPPEASYEEALEHYLKAEEISSGFWKKNMVEIAVCYMKLDNVSLAREWAEKALTLPRQTEEDESAHAEAQELLKKL